MDRAALAAGAAPGVADPAQPVAAQRVIEGAKPNGPYGDRMQDAVSGYRAALGSPGATLWRETVHRRNRALPPVARQCLACGVIAEVVPGRPCESCGASPFHLIPLPPTHNSAA